MASVQKFTDSAVTNQLRHNAREIVNNSNKDIDKTRGTCNKIIKGYQIDNLYLERHMTGLTPKTDPAYTGINNTLSYN